MGQPPGTDPRGTDSSGTDAAAATTAAATTTTAVATAAATERNLKAWYLYNWANHGWATPVAAVLVGPWMLALADSAVGDHGTLIAIGALKLKADAFPSAMITVAALVQLGALPFFGAAADARAAKRRWLILACVSGSIVCCLLAFTGGSEWLLVGLLFIAGSTIEGISDLTWNGMLPELAGPTERDAVSSRATAVGYLGAGILLIVELLIVDLHASIGVGKAPAVRICFAVAGLWWAGFGWRALARLEPATRLRPAGAPDGAAGGRTGGPATLRSNLATMRTMPHARRYVISYLLFADATSAVISLASIFLTHQLFDDNTTQATPFLFELILLIQFIALLGALALGRLAVRFGAKRALVVGLLIWSAVIVFAYAFLQTRLDAVIAGVGIGVALGGTSALARSLFSQMIPVGSEATWFGIYEVCSQGTAWIAPLLFTVVVDVTGSFRQAILSLIVLFVAGLAVLAFVDPTEAAREASEATVTSTR